MAALGSLLGLRRDRHRRPAAALYAAAVVAARAPALFAEGGIPDTVDGRFDSVCLFVLLLIERLRLLPEPGPALAQAVFDAMFSDMDVNLREMGVGDLSVARRMKAMWDAFHGRALAYRPALDAGDAAGLRRRSGATSGAAPPPPGAAEALAAQALAEDAPSRGPAAGALPRRQRRFPAAARSRRDGGAAPAADGRADRPRGAGDPGGGESGPNAPPLPAASACRRSMRSPAGSGLRPPPAGRSRRTALCAPRWCRSAWSRPRNSPRR